jgi:hypothetical protein
VLPPSPSSQGTLGLTVLHLSKQYNFLDMLFHSCKVSWPLHTSGLWNAASWTC